MAVSLSVSDAIEYHKQGWAVLPIARGSKRAVVSNWRAVRYIDESDIARDFNNTNIGIIMGAASGNLIDIDLDEPISSSIAAALMPDTLTFGRKGKPNSHRLYQLTDWSVGCKKYVDPITRATLVEIRGDGGQTIFPGSVHHSGESIEWSTEGNCVTPTQINREQLNNYANIVASATIIAKYWPSGSRHDAALALAGWFVRNKIGTEEIQSFMHAVTSAAKDEEQRDRLSAIQTTLNRFEEGENVSGYPTLLEKIDERILKAVSKWMGLLARSVSERAQINCTDEGNVDRFIEQHKENIRYSAEEKAWYVWNNKIWEKDIRLQVNMLGAETARKIYEEAAIAQTQAEREELANWATQSNNITRREAMIKLAKGRKEITMSIHDFNANPDLITVLNGTFDLSTGTMLPFDREHLITKMARVEYNPAAPVPYIVRMIEQSIKTKDSIKALQKACGLALSGRTDKAVFFCYGPTDTGKTTFLTQGLQRMLQDYAKQVSLEAIVGGKDRGKEIWLADIHGARYALASEPPSGFVLDTAAVKSMTGDSTQKARALYEMPFDSIPVATMFIDTNYRPNIPEGDDAIWNRIQLIHFKNKVRKVPGEPGYIPNFKQVISEPIEMSGLLNWCIAGFEMWLDEGLTRSAEMENDKKEYRGEQDMISQFIDQCVTYDENAATPIAILWEAYQNWEKTQGIDFNSRQKRGPLYDVLTSTHNWKVDGIRYGATKKVMKCWIGVQLNERGTENMPQGSGESEQTFKKFTE